MISSPYPLSGWPRLSYPTPISLLLQLFLYLLYVRPYFRFNFTLTTPLVHFCIVSLIDRLPKSIVSSSYHLSISFCMPLASSQFLSSFHIPILGVLLPTASFGALSALLICIRFVGQRIIDFHYELEFNFRV